VAGDQQAATFGQACFSPGMAKNTYGTGCFLLMNTGNVPIESRHRMLTTIGWGIGGRITYCLEGSVFIGGAVVQWLRDGLGVIANSAEVESLAAQVADSGDVYFVPAFVGMGAPYWDPYARGTIHGITRGTTAAHLARAALESMAYQTRDVLEAMQKDAGIHLAALRVDGGASVNHLLMQFQTDVLGVPVCGRDDGPGRGLPRRVGRRLLAGLRGTDAELGCAMRVFAKDARRRARCEIRSLAEGRGKIAGLGRMKSETQNPKYETNPKFECGNDQSSRVSYFGLCL
jgi:sugar (pentulose or hexulose) kinase